MSVQIADPQTIGATSTPPLATNQSGGSLDELGSPVRGIINALLIAAPFWAFVALMLYYLI
jgi:hypothetical protein